MSISDLNEHDAVCVRRLVEKAVEEGYRVTVVDDGMECAAPSTDVETILADVGNVDDEWIRLYRFGERKVENVGMFFLVYGNGPGETINDHSDKEECYKLYDYANEPWKDAD